MHRGRWRGALGAGAAGLMAGALAIAAQPGSDPLAPAPNGPRRPEPTLVALVNATVIPEPGQKVERATVVMRDGWITQVLTAPAGAGADAWRPDVPGARVVDATGLWVYAGLVEAYAEVDAPKPDADQKGQHWNELVTPQRSALDGKGIDEATAGALRKIGFTAAALVPRGGIFKGSADVVSLRKPSAESSVPRPPVYARRVYQALDFDRVRGERPGEARWPGYPDSLMGCIALMRQTFIDADWQASARATGDYKGALNALDYAAQARGEGPAASPTAAARFVFSADDELEVLRAIKIAREFDRRAVVVGSGLEFRRLDAIAAAAAPQAGTDGSAPGAWVPLILPLRYPEKAKVGSVGEADAADLCDLMSWEQAPTNVRRVMRAAPSLAVAITSGKVKDRGQFMENLRRAIKNGLSEEQALAALTTTPATILGLGGEMGRVAAGQRANVILADGNLFAKRTKVRSVWVDGVEHEINPAPGKVEGTYELDVRPALVAGKAGEAAPALELTFDKDNAVTVRVVAPGAEPAAPDAKPADPAAPGGAGDAGGGEAVNPLVDEPAGAKKGKEKEKGKPKSAKGKNVQVLGAQVNFVIDAADLGGSGVWSFSGLVDLDPQGKVTGVRGQGVGPGGEAVSWSGVVRPAQPKAPDDGKEAEKAGAPAKPEDAISGTWSLLTRDEAMPGVELKFEMRLKRHDDGTVSGEIAGELGVMEASGTFDAGGGVLALTLKVPDGSEAQLDASVKEGRLTGKGRAGTMTHEVTGERTGRAVADGKGEGAGDDDGGEPAPEQLPGYPVGSYAMKAVPAQERVVITNATVWTSGPAGVIQEGEVEFEGGRITYVGAARGSRAGETGGPRVIDARGKHVTPGIIDSHSHTGISGSVNESGMSVTSQVRIGDVTNPDSISWYRQLAGGVTAVNSLHGSANPMGGQNQVNKVRWGSVAPDDMHFEGAIPGIKFALGENVKQSNWGERFTTRYPQTRMGVEALMRDRFLAAREYAQAMEDFKSKRFVRATTGPRRDLQLEALAEVLAGQRLVHCHSYRQDEIAMMGQIAREFGFKIGTFQHILEGYKAAEVIAAEAGGAAGFADWWGYKVEVQDAIPQNGPIMHEQGIVVSFNSDSDDLARRLNVEAAKAVKYSRREDGTYSVTPEEALKFVTINPAKQLRVDGRVGSLEAGKDADVVIWSGSPLSGYSRAEATYVDGRCYFSLEMDRALRDQNQRERTRIVQKVLGAKKPSTEGRSADEGAGPAAAGTDESDGPSRGAAGAGGANP